MKIKLYLTAKQNRRYENGDAKFFIELEKEFKRQGYNLVFGEQTDFVQITAGVTEEYAIIQKALSPSDNVFSIREFGHLPYVTVENAANRNEFRLSKLDYNESVLDEYEKEFYWLYKRIMKSEPMISFSSRGENVLVPLQGGLLDKRTDVSMNVIDMLKDIRKHLPDRVIVTRLHPGYAYKKVELEALQSIEKELGLVRDKGPLESSIESADYLVGLNSTTHLKAMFYGRPSVLYGGADFASNCLSIYNGMSPEKAFAEIGAFKPNFRAYLVWYFSQMVLMWPKQGPKQVIRIMQQLGLPKPD